MKKISFLCLCGLAALTLRAQPPRPVIAHEPPGSVVGGEALRLVARVSSADPLDHVTVHVAQTGGAAPVQRPMRSAGAGVYTVQIPPELFDGADTFRYYIEARTEAGAFAETNWMTVRVIRSAPRADTARESDWRRPALIGAGAVAAVGAGVILADSGSGSGNGDSSDPSDPADQLIVRTASDQVNSPNVALPRTQVVDVAGDLAGRGIRRVRVRLDFDAVNGGSDTYEVRYNNATVLSGSTATRTVEQVDVVGGAGTQVLIQVNNSTPVDGLQAFSWSATITYFVE